MKRFMQACIRVPCFKGAFFSCTILSYYTKFKQRLDKWNKTSRRFQKVDVDSFCLWLDKSKEQIIEEFYSIEKAIMLSICKRYMKSETYATLCK